MMLMRETCREIGWGRTLSGTAYAMLIGLTGHADLDGFVMMHIKDMAEKLDLTENSASRALTELVRADLVSRTRFRGRYRLTEKWLYCSEPDEEDEDTMTSATISAPTPGRPTALAVTTLLREARASTALDHDQTHTL